MKHKTAELVPPLLDYAVARAEAVALLQTDDLTQTPATWDEDEGCWRGWTPSTDWRVGGPIIQRERINLQWNYMASPSKWVACVDFTHGQETDSGDGPTPLIAAMRAYVASKLGEEVELP